MKNDMTRKIVGHPYKDRETRNKFIAETFNAYIGNTVLNIGGGGKRYLKNYLPEEVEYYELDIAGEPDLKINLEKDTPLPIKDNAYETVICTDVLEHLDNMHEVFDELIRVSSNYLIISLPNAVSDVSAYIKDKPYKEDSMERKMKFGKYMKFYGLPYEKPDDRHKWFFSYTEAEEFIFYKSSKLGVEVEEIFGLNYRSSNVAGAIVRSIVKTTLGENVRKNLFSSVLWCVLRTKK